MPSPPFPVVLTYCLLALSVVSLWAPPLRTRHGAHAWWPWILALATLAGLATGLVAPKGVALLAGYGLAAAVATRLPAGWTRRALHVLLGLGALLLALHAFGGFVNPAIVQNLPLCASCPPLTARLNFDTAAAGIILCGTLCRRARSRDEWCAVLAAWPWIVGPAVVVNVAALLVGYAKFEPKLPAYLPYFVAINLLFTCVTEEAFFRGLIQEKLAARLAGSGVASRADSRAGSIYWPLIAIFVTSLLFGLAHARGGALLVGLAALAGIGYGLAYRRSGRIEAAIAAHLALNCTHFVLLSYPRAL